MARPKHQKRGNPKQIIWPTNPKKYCGNIREYKPTSKGFIRFEVYTSAFKRRKPISIGVFNNREAAEKRRRIYSDENQLTKNIVFIYDDYLEFVIDPSGIRCRADLADADLVERYVWHYRTKVGRPCVFAYVEHGRRLTFAYLKFGADPDITTFHYLDGNPLNNRSQNLLPRRRKAIANGISQLLEAAKVIEASAQT